MPPSEKARPRFLVEKQSNGGYREWCVIIHTHGGGQGGYILDYYSTRWRAEEAGAKEIKAAGGE